MNNFADDLASIHLGNVEEQIKDGHLFGLGKKKYSTGSSSSTSNLSFFCS